MPSNVLPLHLKQTFPPIIWIFTEGEGDEIEFRLPFKINSTLPIYWEFELVLIHKSQLNVEGSSSSRAAFKDQKRWERALPKKVGGEWRRRGGGLTAELVAKALPGLVLVG